MSARIFKPAKTAMQSGHARAREWVLEHDNASGRTIDPLMGWTTSTNTEAQVRLEFATREEAVAYAERNGIAYTLLEPAPHKPVRRTYAENFRYGRKDAWTH